MSNTALLISTLLMVALNIFQMRGLLDRYLLNSALPASLEAIANSVERDLQAPITASELIANNHYPKDWLAAGEPEQGLAPASRLASLPCLSTHAWRMTANSLPSRGLV